MLYPLLKAAEQLRGLAQATIELTVNDPTGHIAAKRKELDKLLRDYGCTVEWTEHEEDEA